MMGWSSGTLQSKTLRGLVTARRWQSEHILSTTGASDWRRASLNFARSAGLPTEFSSRVQLVTPTRSSSVARSSRISASLAGDWLPAGAGPGTSPPVLVDWGGGALLWTARGDWAPGDEGRVWKRA